MCWSSNFRILVVGAFRSYCRERDWDFDSRVEDGVTSLQQILAMFFEDWTEHVVMLTGNDPEVWREVVLIVIDAYGRDPSILDYGCIEVDGELVASRSRRVERMLDLEAWGADFLDPRWYRALAAGVEW